MKNEILQRLDAVCKTLDGGIVVSGVKNAGNLAGCYTVLQEAMVLLSKCEVTEPKPETEAKSEE